MISWYSPVWQKRYLFCYRIFWCSGWAASSSLHNHCLTTGDSSSQSGKEVWAKCRQWSQFPSPWAGEKTFQSDSRLEDSSLVVHRNKSLSITSGRMYQLEACLHQANFQILSSDMAKQDLNEQTAIDMANARKATLVSVENLRDFLYSEHLSELPNFRRSPTPLQHRWTK